MHLIQAYCLVVYYSTVHTKAGNHVRCTHLHAAFTTAYSRQGRCKEQLWLLHIYRKRFTKDYDTPFATCSAMSNNKRYMKDEDTAGAKYTTSTNCVQHNYNCAATRYTTQAPDWCDDLAVALSTAAAISPADVLLSSQLQKPATAAADHSSCPAHVTSNNSCTSSRTTGNKY